MSNQEILENAIKIAYSNGYSLGYKITASGDTLDASANFDIIFSHDFAKALWGKENLLAWGYSPTEHVGNPHPVKITEWQYHLQNMVISDNPIEYLGENI